MIRPATPLDLLRLSFGGPPLVLQLDAPHSLVAGAARPLTIARRLLETTPLVRQPHHPTFVLLHRNRVLAYARLRPDPRATAAGSSWTLTALGVREGALDNDEVAETMLEAAAQAAGQAGITRLFARVPDDVGLLDVLHRVGFQSFAEETVWVKPSLAERSKDGPVPAYLPRPQARRDAWALFQLYLALTPTAVHHAEGYNSRHWQEDSRLPIHPLRHASTHLWDDGRAIRAYLHTQSGPGGHLAEMLVAPDADPGLVDAVLGHTLTTLKRAGANKPLYIPVRDYQPGLQAALEERGFRPLLRQVALVKYTTTWLRSPALARQPRRALRVPAEAIPARGGLVVNTDAEPQPQN